MRRSQVAFAAALLIGALAGASDTITAQADSAESSLSVFPNEITIDVKRGERVDEAIGIIQTGAAERTMQFEVTGEAAAFVSVVNATDGTPLTNLTAPESQPVYAVVRVEPQAGVPDGQREARIRIIADDGEVALGSELRVSTHIDGDYDLKASLLGAHVVGPTVEQGRPVRVTLDLDVDGSAALVPIVSVRWASPDGSVVDLAARPETPESAESGGRHTLEVAWPTSDWALGSHHGELTLTSGSVEIGRAALDVEVVPAGSLSSALTLLRAELASTARPNGVAKVIVTVRNDGEIDGRAVFAGDLVYGTEVVSPIRSDPLQVGPGETADLTVYAELGDPGSYRVRGRAVMDGAETGIVAVEFEAAAASQRTWLWVGLASLALVVALGVVSLSRRHR